MISRIGLVVLAMTIGMGTLLVADELPPIRLSPGSASAVCASSAPLPATVRKVNIQTENWTWQMFPSSFIYPTYLAAVQNRLGGAWNYDEHENWVWDITLGGRAPLLRYGTRSTLYPEGWQLDMEGSVHLRLHLREAMDMEANDFRFGLPVSYGTKVWQVRGGYYHVSTHMGDNRIIRHYTYNVEHGLGPGAGDPAVPNDPTLVMGTRNKSNYRINYCREALLFSYAFRPTDNTRLYAEVDYAVIRSLYTKPWHFQFGAEYSPMFPAARGEWGTPFAAINARLMQEHNFDGNVTLQAGWQWRGTRNQLLRLGVQYHAGISEHYSFIHHRRENKIGFGVWYDF